MLLVGVKRPIGALLQKIFRTYQPNVRLQTAAIDRRAGSNDARHRQLGGIQLFETNTQNIGLAKNEPKAPVKLRASCGALSSN